MSKKKDKKSIIKDFTLNDCANAPKPVHTIKKSALDTTPDLSWDEIQDDHEIIEETNSDGTKQFAYRQKAAQVPIDEPPGNVYPEIIWYWISRHIKPEDIGKFALINKATYAVTKKKSFWLRLYKTYCDGHPKLPERLRVDSYKEYGLRQTVIRALYYTYDVFIERVTRRLSQDSYPHKLIKRRCVTVWYKKCMLHWSVYFKLRTERQPRTEGVEDFLEEMGRVDANNEEDTQVLQIICRNFRELPPVMGMTLTCASMTLTQGFRHYILNLGFNTSRYFTKGVVPEYVAVFDPVVMVQVWDWWHPQYPHNANLVPSSGLTLLRRDFFDDD